MPRKLSNEATNLKISNDFMEEMRIITIIHVGKLISRIPGGRGSFSFNFATPSESGCGFILHGRGRFRYTRRCTQLNSSSGYHSHFLVAN